MKILKWQYWLFLICIGCQSDTERLRQVEHGFIQIVEASGQFPLCVEGDTLWLPVLPLPETNAKVKEEAAILQGSLQNIDLQSLEMSDQKRLTILKQALGDIIQNGFSIPVDQVCSQIARPFQQALQYNNQPLTERFVAYLPGYFAEMEQRWQRPSEHKTPEAIREALAAFDALQQIEQQAPNIARHDFDAARRSLKDYIGLCQSASLQ